MNKKQSRISCLNIKGRSPFYINSAWKKFFGCGCSHGYLIDPIARLAILEFINSFKPDIRAHLGDFIDTAALRSGAEGTNDEEEDIDHDLTEGLHFLNEMAATDVDCGNHEARIWKMFNSRKAKARSLARRLIADIRNTCIELKANLYEYKGIFGFRQFRNFKIGHGYLFNENSCRDHAEAHGNVIFAHTHRAGIQSGRRDDEPIGICVGTLTAKENMDYASNRRSTLGWSQAFVYGYYNDKVLQPYLCIKQKDTKEWLLP